jgi:hypothetical protein
MAITKRLVKGSALTHTELDSNFTDLDGRVTTLENTPDSDSQTLTLAGDNLTISGGNTVDLSTINSTGILNVVEDTTPQLGGNLDLNGNQITGSGGSSVSESLNVLTLVGGSNGIIMRAGGNIVIGDQAQDVVLGNSSNSVEFVNGVDVDFTNTNVDFTSATVTGLSIVQGIDDLSDVDTSTTPPGVGQVLKWDGAQWEPANDSSGSGGITLTALSVVSASASASPSLVYNNTTGVFTYTPPNLSELATDLDINGNDITGTGNINITGSITSTAVGTPTITSATDIIFAANSGSGIVNVSGSKITNVGTPTAGTDAATKAYVDANGGGSGISNVVEDTTPQLGGNLDAQAFDITTTGKILYSNVYSTEGDLPSASTYHGMFAHVHGTGAGYFAHSGSWVRLANQSEISGGFAIAGNTGTHTFNTATETLTFLGTTGQINAGIAANNVTLELDPNINSIVSISFEGATADNFETKLQAVDPTADRTINLPDADGTVALLSDISSGGLPTRSTATGTTGSLADAAQADLDITGFKSYTLLTITTDKAARVRLYVNAATRTADASRAEGTDPAADAGLIAEVITTGAETVIISPGAYGFNLESSPTTNIPCRVTNKSGSTGTVQIDLNILQLES